MHCPSNFFPIRSHVSCTSVINDCDEQIAMSTNILFIGDKRNRELFYSFHKFIIDNTERYRAKCLEWSKCQVCRDGQIIIKSYIIKLILSWKIALCQSYLAWLTIIIISLGKSCLLRNLPQFVLLSLILCQPHFVAKPLEQIFLMLSFPQQSIQPLQTQQSQLQTIVKVL